MKYSKLAKTYTELEATTKGLEKTAIIANFLKKVKVDDLRPVVLLLQGIVFIEYDGRKIGIGSKLAIKAVASAAGTTAKNIERKWAKKGDLGEVAKEEIQGKRQRTLFSRELTVDKVIGNLQKMAELQGSGTVDKKVGLLKELLSSADGDSAKYIVRTCLEDLRIGVGAGILRDAISKAFDKDKNEIQRAYDVTTDFAEVAYLTKTGKALSRVKTKLGNPIKVMLYQKAEDLDEAFQRVGKPAAFEYKYDGFRMQIHVKSNEVKLFTRRLEDVTKQFPDVVELIKKNVKSKECILDSEIIGLDLKTKQWLPFQSISQRIKRKYDIHRITKEIPIIVNVFDVLYYQGQSMLETSFKDRRKLIEKIVNEVPNKIHLAKQIVTSSETEAKKFFSESLRKGNEGLMAKNLEAGYKPGSRVGYGVKVKPVAESLDLVIVGAEYGTGRRGGWLTSFYLACYDQNSGQFLRIGFIRLREDRSPKDSDRIDRVKKLYSKQRGRKK